MVKIFLLHFLVFGGDCLIKVTNEEKKALSATRLRACRKEAGLTQAKLIDRICEIDNKSRDEKQISYIENQKRQMSPEYAHLIGEVLGIRPEYLLGEDDFKTKAALLKAPMIIAQKEGSYLNAAFQFLAELNGYRVELVNPAPVKDGKIAFDDMYAEVTGGIKISRGQKSAIFTLNEFSALENEICNFADYRIHCIVEGSD